MTQEEKAKAYDEALEKARKRVSVEPQDHTDAILKDIFPELRESEDERIRKWLIELVKSTDTNHSNMKLSENCKIALSYLEKQKEQKPVEWSDADMREARDNLISVCRDWERGELTTLLPIVATRARYFLEHLIEPQKPAEWSEYGPN